MKGLQTGKEGRDGGMRERPQGRELMGRRVEVILGEKVCVCCLERLVWIPFTPCWMEFFLPLSFFLFFAQIFSFPLWQSLSIIYCFLHFFSSNLLRFVSLSCVTFLLSSLSWLPVYDVIQNNKVKLVWNVAWTERTESERKRVGKS